MNGLLRVGAIAGISSLVGFAAWSQGSTTCPDWTAESDQPGAGFGFSADTAGDVNGDGYDDVIVGSGFQNGEINEGRAFVYLGSSAGLSTSPAWTAEPNQVNAYFSRSVSTAGDVNGDGYDDVIVGAQGFGVGEVGEGWAFVYLGSATGLSRTPAWTAESNRAGAFFGISVSTAGDVNGDGYDDVIVGAQYFTNFQANEGRAYVYLGSPTGLSTNPAWTADGLQVGAWFGASVSDAGDVNGDGYDDVIVGAPLFDNGQTNEGRADVYLGSAAGLSRTPASSVESDQAGKALGGWVGCAGDVNGDGYDDVLVGRYFWDAVYVYLGSATGISSSAAWSAVSSAVATAGDVNGDGYSDVIVGDPEDEGAVHEYLGSALGLSTSPAWSAEGDQVDSGFGFTVSTAGDVDGDGYDDVIVGARWFDNGQAEEGRAYAHLGSAMGLARSAVYRGDQINADTITPLDVVLGSTWSAPLAMGHPHGTNGSIYLSVRSGTINGPNFPSPVGARLTEILVSGLHLASIGGVHDGVAGDIAPQLIPNQPALVGLPWAAQYIVIGGGFADLSEAVYGIVDSCP